VGFWKERLDKPLAILTKRRWESPKLIKLEIKKGAVTANTNEIQKVIRKYFKNLYSNKLENLKEIDKFLYICIYIYIYMPYQNWTKKI
jgi:hypothetical protein